MVMEPCRRRSSGQWWGRLVRITKVFGRFQLFGCIGVMMTEEELADMVEVGKYFLSTSDQSFRMLTGMGRGLWTFKSLLRWWLRFGWMIVIIIFNMIMVIVLCSNFRRIAIKVSRYVFLQRESEKETVQELKQAFRVFDKVQLGIWPLQTYF